MQSLRSLIGSPIGLLAFEAAARHHSFTLAGRELNVTQAAVSFAVKRLEESLGVTLFLRHHRRIELTDLGARFYQDVSMGLTHIRRSAEELRLRHNEKRVTIAVSTGFATYWMMPRLRTFLAEHPGIELRFHTSERDVDLAGEGIDLGIYRGEGTWDRYHAVLLAPEEVYPVCSPAYVGTKPALQAPLKPAALTDLDLIHLEEPVRYRPGWSDWFASAGLSWKDSGTGLRLNDYAVILQAAIEAEGVALGWNHLVLDLIRRGRLLRLSDHSMRSDSGIFIVWPKHVKLSPASVIVRDWLERQARREGLADRS